MFLTSQQYIRSFLEYLKFQKRYSQHTIISYENDLISYFDFQQLQFNESLAENTKAAFVRSWLASLKEQGMTSKSIIRKISSLKSFFKYLLRQQVIEVSPMVTIISPKTNKRLPKYIEKEDVDTLFTHVEFPDTWEGRTQKLALELLYNTGIRQAELINLKEIQVDMANQATKYLESSKERTSVSILDP